MATLDNWTQLLNLQLSVRSLTACQHLSVFYCISVLICRHMVLLCNTQRELA